MRNKVFLGISIVALVAAIGWSISRSMAQRLGSNGNNGSSTQFMMPSPKIRKKMEEMRQNPPEIKGDPTDPAQQEKMRGEFEKQLDPQEKEEFKKMAEEMKKRMEETRAALSPDDQRALMRRFMSMGGPGGRGPGRGAPPPPPSAPPN